MPGQQASRLGFGDEAATIAKNADLGLGAYAPAAKAGKGGFANLGAIGKLGGKVLAPVGAAASIYDIINQLYNVGNPESALQGTLQGLSAGDWAKGGRGFNAAPSAPGFLPPPDKSLIMDILAGRFPPIPKNRLEVP